MTGCSGRTPEQTDTVALHHGVRFYRNYVSAAAVIVSMLRLRIAALAGNIPLRDGALSVIKGHLVAFLHVIDRSTVRIVKFSRVPVADIGR